MAEYLDFAIAKLDQTVSLVSETVQEWSLKWQQTMDDMKAKAREFIRVFQDLEAKRAIAEKDPSLKAEYDSLMSKGGLINRTISTLLSDEGTSAMNAVGVLPLIPIAAVAAAIAAITAWLSSAYVMLSKIELAEKALEKGQAVAPILEAGEGGFLTDVTGAATNFTKLALVVGGGFLLWKFWPQIQKRLG